MSPKPMQPSKIIVACLCYPSAYRVLALAFHRTGVGCRPNRAQHTLALDERKRSHELLLLEQGSPASKSRRPVMFPFRSLTN
jgi:hypothetical protein